MSDAEINIAVAEILGWTAPVGWDGHWPQRQHYSIPGCKSVVHGVPPGKKQKKYLYSVGVQDNLEPVPNYAGCLNAMQTAEQVLTDAQFEDYFNELEFQMPLARPARKRRHVCSAPARQRAEAFLRVFGQWKEGV